MLLNIWQTIREFFIDLFTNISWGDLVLLLTGVVIGFLICGIIYIIVVLKGIKKAENNYNKQKDEDEIIKTTEVNNLINGTKDRFKEETLDYSMGQKIDCIKNISWDLVNDIAKIYYPESKYPIYELSIDELIKLGFYITEKIDRVFEGKIIGKTRNIKISHLMTFIEKKKQVEDSKIIKASKKANVGGVAKLASTVINFVNPAYWVKKAVIGTTLSLGTNKVANIIIDIVGQETAKVYSKNLFDNNNELDKEIAELDNELNMED